MKRARIIYNPTSGREVIRKVLPDILQRFEQAGYETSAHATTCAGDAINAAKYCVEQKFDVVVAAGGDGTINEVINGLAEQEHKPKLGIIPVGTTNDFARALHIPRNVHKAVDIILEDYTHPLDIGRVNDHYFMNIAGGGKITEISYEVPSKLKTMLGQLAYYLKGIEMLPSIRPTRVEMEYDGKWYEGEIMLFLVSNTNSVGGLEKLAPAARMDDGLFDLMIIEKMNIAEFVRLATLAIQGNHLNHPKFVHLTASRVKVKTDEKMQLNIDGEFGGLLPGEFVNLYRHLDFFVPEQHFKTEE
ncbi:diacylglycerol kinase [Halobacillus sp. ACCC02827]|uniref:diacylglycerol kinase n=1 Tax=Bacillaceae TaxID=186817 RepID=UPI0002A4D5B4|nr:MULTISPECIES: diacylglycerol kinase [Bacillaceae]ELK44390.1 lipid kinase [Halobacillus sp. BAB-2008]QHT45568.1 diacylglycerol kinase [Bacillus sp. SB49]WJE16371.1 diacylglycerol kinase [Halobacillus sp. ACCC02827]